MIRNVLFDIGKVLLSFEREPTLRDFARYSTTIGEQDFEFGNVFVSPYWEQMELGELSPREYYGHFRRASGCRISYRHFVLIWTAHFTPTQAIVDYGRSLAGKYGIYFFSNTDPIHIPPLFERFPSLLFFDGCALSWELGARKPDPRFFHRGLAKFGLDPTECLFVDDRPENTRTARKLGMQAVDFRSPSQTIARMDTILAKS